MKINLIPGNIIDPKEYDLENSYGVDFIVDSYTLTRLKNSLEEGTLLVIGKDYSENIPKDILRGSEIITPLIDYIIGEIWNTCDIQDMPILRSIELDLESDCIII